MEKSRLENRILDLQENVLRCVLICGVAFTTQDVSLSYIVYTSFPLFVFSIDYIVYIVYTSFPLFVFSIDYSMENSLSYSLCRLQQRKELSPEKNQNGPGLSSTPLSRQSSLQQELEAQEVQYLCMVFFQ